MERFIAENYTQSLTLDRIARDAGVSRQHLLKLCRLSAKPTPIDQLYAKRLEVATKIDRGEMTEQQGQVETEKIFASIQATERQRDAAAR